MPEKNKDDNFDTTDPIQRRMEELLSARDGKTPPEAKAPLSTAPALPSNAADHEHPAGLASGEQPDASTGVSPDASPLAAVPVDDAAVDPLVDDIVAREGDELLAAKDAEIAKAFNSERPGPRERIVALARRWWDNKPARYGTLGVLAIGIVSAGVVPDSRYFVLNTAGVRASASVTILDSTNDLPLKNVKVSVPGQTVRTNQDGVVRLENLKLGQHDLVVERLGFAPVNRKVTVGLGSNPLGNLELKAVGTQFRFQLTDYLSGKPVGNAEISYGDDVSAQSDNKGEVILTIGRLSEKNLELEVKAIGYRDEKMSIEPTRTATTQLPLVLNRKQVYVSKQSGKYDVYKIDVDGRNKQILLAGTGIENERLALVADPTGKQAAYVSTRENKRNQDGYLLQTLTILDVEDGDALTLENSERIQIVGWVKDRLIYVKIKAGTSAGSQERHQLVSYNITTSARLQLASANYFTDVMIAKGVVYYAATTNNQDNQSQFASVGADNTGRQTIVNEAVWNIARSSYDDLNLNGNDKWFSYKLGDTSAKKLATPPGNSNETRFYLDASDGGQALWTDTRDGKGVLLMYDPASRKDKTLATQSGLTYPLRWLDNRTVIYRITTPQETADYVLDIESGTPKKIADVTNASGLGTWFYY